LNRGITVLQTVALGRLATPPEKQAVLYPRNGGLQGEKESECHGWGSRARRDKEGRYVEY
jgi:hypothetical protein